MPHQCTQCGHVFPDGSKQMLGGCPDCGGNKFQFHPGEVPADATPADPPSRPEDRSNVASAVGKAASTLKGFVSGSASGRDPDRRTASDAGSRSTVETEQATLDAVAANVNAEAEAARGAGSGESAAEADAEAGAAADPPSRTRLTAEGEWPETARPPDVETASRAERPAGTSSGSSDESTAGASADGPSADEDVTSAHDGTAAADLDVETDVGGEDRAQADARSAVVAEDELPSTSGVTDERPTPAAEQPGAEQPAAERPASDARTTDEPSGERPGLAELREELNNQFESIRVVEPGQYELNLMELYDRDEYIIAIQENGKYVIEVPDSWNHDE